MPTSPEASADGTLTSHSCDGGYEIRIKVVPGKTYPAGAKRDIMKGGGLGEEKPPNQQEHKVGEIPQVEKTFTRYDASYPFMNEKGVIIGETTIGGRRELYSDEGLFDIMELERPRARAWVHRTRSHPDHGRVRREIRLRRQRRVPDGGRREGSLAVRDLSAGGHRDRRRLGGQAHSAGEVGVSANVSRITTLTDDPNFTMHSKNVYDVAEKLGWWKKASPSCSTGSTGWPAPRGRTAGSGGC